MACRVFLLQLICCVVIHVQVGGYVYVEKESNRITNRSSSAPCFLTGLSFRIRNRISNLFMTDVSTQTPNSSIKQFPQKTGSDSDGQVWFVLPSAKDGCLIANKETGLFLYQLPKGENGWSSTGLAIPNTYSEPHWIWKIQQAATGTMERFYTIKNMATQWFLLIGSYRTDAGAIVQHWPAEKTSYLESQQWAFQTEGLQVDDPNVNRSVTDIGDIIRITSWKQPIPSKTDEVLIGQVAISSMLILDPVLNMTQKLKLSPFYYLRRYGYWHVIAYHDHSGSSHTTLATNVTLGLVTRNAKAIEEIASLCVTSESWLCIVGSFLTSWIEEIASGLRINVEENFDEVNSKNLLLERKYVGLNRLIDIVWFREDRYVLERMYGEKVLDWVTRVPITISDSYRGRQLPMSISSTL